MRQCCQLSFPENSYRYMLYKKMPKIVVGCFSLGDFESQQMHWQSHAALGYQFHKLIVSQSASESAAYAASCGQLQNWVLGLRPSEAFSCSPSQTHYSSNSPRSWGEKLGKQGITQSEVRHDDDSVTEKKIVTSTFDLTTDLFYIDLSPLEKIPLHH